LSLIRLEEREVLWISAITELIDTWDKALMVLGVVVFAAAFFSGSRDE
jgi:hypothetical protein